MLTSLRVEKLANGALVLEWYDQHARLIITRPEVSNSANFELWQALDKAVAKVGANESIRALVITGAGPRAFMAGADISEFPLLLANPERLSAYLHAALHAIDAVEALPIPVLGEINGAAMGGGMELAIACDVLIAAENAKFGIPAANIGLAIKYADIERLVGILGTARTRDILILGKTLTAAEALGAGLVSEVVPQANLAARCQEVVLTICKMAPLSIASTKAVLRSIIHRWPHPDDAGRTTAAASIDAAWASTEIRTRVAAFANRKKG